MKDFYTIVEVAEIKRVSKTQILRNIKKKKYPSAEKRGNTWFIHKRDL